MAIGKVLQIRRGNIIAVPNMRLPEQGAQAVPVTLDFTANTTFDGDLSACFGTGVFDFAQSVFIDNKDNQTTLTLTFPGVGNRGQVIQVQPLTQGYYPISPGMGDGRFTAFTAGGQIIDVIFFNVAMPYFTWGPLPGVLVVPALSSRAFAPLALALGDNQLVAGVGGQTIKAYRGIFGVDNPAILKFTDGPGGTVLFTADLSALGSLTWQASGVPWITTGVGNDLTLNSSAAVNLYGGMGYVQS